MSDWFSSFQRVLLSNQVKRWTCKKKYFSDNVLRHSFLTFHEGVNLTVSLCRCLLWPVLRRAGPWWRSGAWTWACLCRSCRGGWRWPGSRVTPGLRVTSLLNSKRISYTHLMHMLNRHNVKTNLWKYLQRCLREVSPVSEVGKLMCWRGNKTEI